MGSGVVIGVGKEVTKKEKQNKRRKGQEGKTS